MRGQFISIMKENVARPFTSCNGPRKSATRSKRTRNHTDKGEEMRTRKLCIGASELAMLQRTPLCVLSYQLLPVTSHHQQSYKYIYIQSRLTDFIHVTTSSSLGTAATSVILSWHDPAAIASAQPIIMGESTWTLILWIKCSHGTNSILWVWAKLVFWEATAAEEEPSTVCDQPCYPQAPVFIQDKITTEFLRTFIALRIYLSSTKV